MTVFRIGSKVRFTKEFAKEFQKGLDQRFPQENLSVKKLPYNPKHVWTVEYAEDKGDFAVYTLCRGSGKTYWADSGQLEEA